jgi:hypothetical protein
MMIPYDPRTPASTTARTLLTEIDVYIGEAHRLRAEAMAATLGAIGRAAARLARRLRLALLRQRERRRALDELEAYTDQELQRDLLFPRSEIGRIAAREADRRIRALLRRRPQHVTSAG